WAATLWNAFPLTLPMVAALVLLARDVWRRLSGKASRRAATRMAALMLAWAWPAVLFFSVFPYRVRAYVFFVIPVLALALDWAAARAQFSPLMRWSWRVSGSVLMVGGLIAGAFAERM